MLMSAAEDQDVVNELMANKDNRVLDYQYFVPGGGAHPISKPDRLVIVGQEYRPPFYGHVILLGLRDHLLSPCHDRLRGHRHREPVPEQHGHAAQGEGAERDHRLCARVLRRQRSAAVGSRPGQGVHRRRRAEDDGRHRVVVLGARGVLPVVRRPEQRPARHRQRRRRLDERPAHQQAGRIVANVRVHRRQGSRCARVDGWPAQRPRVHEHRPAHRADHQRQDAGRRGAAAGRRGNDRDCRLGQVDRAARQDDADRQRRGARGDRARRAIAGASSSRARSRSREAAGSICASKANRPSAVRWTPALRRPSPARCG